MTSTDKVSVGLLTLSENIDVTVIFRSKVQLKVIFNL